MLLQLLLLNWCSARFAMMLCCRKCRLDFGGEAQQQLWRGVSGYSDGRHASI